MEVANITEPVILIKSMIASGLKENEDNYLNKQMVYEQTRCCWRVDIENAKKAEYAFLVSKSESGESEILEVYKIVQWFPSNTTLSSRQDGHTHPNDRYEFVGNIAKQSIRDKYIGKYVSFLGSNPIKYINI
jgi:hypothetical protein